MVDSVEHLKRRTRIRSVVKEKNQARKTDRRRVDGGDDLGLGISVDIRKDLGRVQDGIDLV